MRDAVRKRMGKQPHGWKTLQRLTYLQHASYSLFHLSVPPRTSSRRDEIPPTRNGQGNCVVSSEVPGNWEATMDSTTLLIIANHCHSGPLVGWWRLLRSRTLVVSLMQMKGG